MLPWQPGQSDSPTGPQGVLGELIPQITNSGYTVCVLLGTIYPFHVLDLALPLNINPLGAPS